MTSLHIKTVGQGEPLVMLHGWGMHSGLWQEFAMQLASAYQVTLVDLPGHGYSKALDQYSMTRVIAELVHTLPEPAVWLGWSMGGAIVLELSQQHPELIKGILLVCSNPKYSRTSDWPHAMKVAVLNAFARAVRENDQITLARFTGLMTQGEGEQARQILRFVRKRLPQAPPANRNALLWGLDVLQNGDFRSIFKHTVHPMRVLLGEDDPLIPCQVAHELASLNQDADIHVLKNAGHVPFLSQQARMVDDVSAFMQRLETA